MLSRDPKILGFVQKNNGTGTSLKIETIEDLLSTHFPNRVDPDTYPDVADPFCNGMMPDLEDIITRDKVK